MVKTAIQTLEENSKADLLAIHENMNGLIERAELITINVDDVESYEDAVNLKRVIKATHVAIEKKRKELKAPIIDAGKRLDEFAKSIYTPLKEAESLLKDKMLPYEQEQERIKEEEKLAKEKEQQEKDALNDKLMQLNSILPEINSCKNKKQVEQIENKLGNINPKDYGERSDEAGFILTNLKMTCSMIKKSLPDDTQEVLMKDGWGEYEEVSIPITEAKEEPVVKHDGMKYNPEKAEQTLEFDFSEVSEVINNSAESPLTDAMEKSEKLRNRISAIDSEIEKLQQEKELLSTELKKVLASIQK
jgi:hypothetical protein